MPKNKKIESMLLEHCCDHHKKIGDYNLCHRCGSIISREKWYCSSCEKKNEQDRKEKEKENTKKAKAQKKELEKNPPHQCSCDPQVIEELSRGKSLDKKAHPSGFFNPKLVYKCHIDERTGVAVCDRCSGTPPEGSFQWIGISL
ncbi:hypothetical protein FACS1894176_05710 [Bacteroidia bacterium]|nr:hypothetical protein FACS1894176_05710 [Bacteroidia bacterium]